MTGFPNTLYKAITPILRLLGGCFQLNFNCLKNLKNFFSLSELTGAVSFIKCIIAIENSVADLVAFNTYGLIVRTGNLVGRTHYKYRNTISLFDIV